MTPGSLVNSRSERESRHAFDYVGKKADALKLSV
jgi:hypothetical protein